jgi:hypothetical protein
MATKKETKKQKATKAPAKVKKGSAPVEAKANGKINLKADLGLNRSFLERKIEQFGKEVPAEAKKLLARKGDYTLDEAKVIAEVIMSPVDKSVLAGTHEKVRAMGVLVRAANGNKKLYEDVQDKIHKYNI